MTDNRPIRKRARSARARPRVTHLLSHLERLREGDSPAVRVGDAQLARLCAVSRRWRAFESVATAAWTFFHVLYDSSSADALARAGWLSLVALIAADAIRSNNPTLAKDALWALRVAEAEAEDWCRCRRLRSCPCAACRIRAAKSAHGLAAVWPLGRPPADVDRLCAAAAT